MGKGSKWFRGLLGLKKTDPTASSSQPAAEVVRLTGNGRAISTNAKATTAPATRMTSFCTAHVSGSGSAGYGSREERAAVEIQSRFRAYLSRRSLRALKALVKLQALVRGHTVRKHTADVLRKMQAMLRSQERASAGRARIFISPHKSV